MNNIVHHSTKETGVSQSSICGSMGDRRDIFIGVGSMKATAKRANEPNAGG